MDKTCEDPNCPVHGTLSTRGIVLEGVVKSDKMRGTVVVRRDHIKKNQKYERYERSHSRLSAHNPPCINAKVDDNVKIMECRKISKTVSFVVIEKIIKEK
ncbi:30S ribosomal protein S17 [Candidatus Altiarchaeota archaeon]